MTISMNLVLLCSSCVIRLDIFSGFCFDKEVPFCVKDSSVGRFGLSSPRRTSGVFKSHVNNARDPGALCHAFLCRGLLHASKPDFPQ
jgi:hypothetical protein